MIQVINQKREAAGFAQLPFSDIEEAEAGRADQRAPQSFAPAPSGAQAKGSAQTDASDWVLPKTAMAPALENTFEDPGKFSDAYGWIRSLGNVEILKP